MEKLLVYIGYLILLINFIVFVSKFNKYGNAYKYFCYYLFTIIIIQSLARILVFYKFQNLVISHFYFILQLVTLSRVYLVLISNAKQKKLINLLVLFCLISLSTQYLLNPALVNTFNLFEIVITSLSLIIIVFFHFYNMLTSKKEFFLISVGLIIYLFGSTFLFLLMHYNVLNQSPLLNIIYPINSVLVIIYQLLIFAEWKINYSKSIL